jgi:hypothetical protein
VEKCFVTIGGIELPDYIEAMDLFETYYQEAILKKVRNLAYSVSNLKMVNIYP